jgi:hypothetical protein
VSLAIRPAAADLDKAFLWYEAQRAGLGSEFLIAVEQVFHIVAGHPVGTLSSSAAPGVLKFGASPAGSSIALLATIWSWWPAFMGDGTYNAGSIVDRTKWETSFSVTL